MSNKHISEYEAAATFLSIVGVVLAIIGWCI